MSKKGLGRGLGALITESETESSEIKEIMLTNIMPNPQQPRGDFDEDKLMELADSIREHGLLQPILVKPEGNYYYIIAGERRFRAAQIAGLDRISCIIRSYNEQEMMEKALIENIQRADLSPLEEGLAYQRLISEYNLTQEQVAKRVGKGRPTIANLIRITQMPPEVLELLKNEKISLGHAKVLLSLEQPGDQSILARKIASEQLSVRDTEYLVSVHKPDADKLSNFSDHHESPEQKAVNKVKTVNKYHVMREVEEKLRTALQTKVIVKGNQNKGRIEIEFYSKDELNRLLEIWNVDI